MYTDLAGRRGADWGRGPRRRAVAGQGDGGHSGGRWRDRVGGRWSRANRAGREGWGGMNESLSFGSVWCAAKHGAHRSLSLCIHIIYNKIPS